MIIIIFPRFFAHQHFFQKPQEVSNPRGAPLVLIDFFFRIFHETIQALGTPHDYSLRFAPGKLRGPGAKSPRIDTNLEDAQKARLRW